MTTPPYHATTCTYTHRTDSAESARAWLRSWEGQATYLRCAIEGLELGASIMRSAGSNYGRERRLDNARALRVLRAAR